jgi:hypothetical protein
MGEVNQKSKNPKRLKRNMGTWEVSCKRIEKY